MFIFPIIDQFLLSLQEIIPVQTKGFLLCIFDFFHPVTTISQFISNVVDAFLSFFLLRAEEDSSSELGEWNASEGVSSMVTAAVQVPGGIGRLDKHFDMVCLAHH